MTSFTVSMKINSEKKHSVRYDATTIDPGVTSIYIMKTSLPDKIPQSVTIKVEMENE